MENGISGFNMSLQDTPNAVRLHIGIFGKRNSGKSTLLNAITKQKVSTVSPVALSLIHICNKIKRQVRMMVQDIYSFEEKFDTIILVRVKYHEENYINNKKLLERLVKKVKI